VEFFVRRRAFEFFFWANLFNFNIFILLFVNDLHMFL